MSWKRVVYVLFVAGIAVISALGGAVAGGIGVYRALNQNQRAGLAHTTPAVEANASTQSAQTQALQVNTTQLPASEHKYRSSKSGFWENIRREGKPIDAL